MSLNKLIVVTGGTKGIGLAVIEKFASQGFAIATCSRNANDLQQLKSRIESLFNVTVAVFHADMSDREAVKKFCEGVLILQKPVEVLVNNAGYFIPGEIATEPEGTL